MSSKHAAHVHVVCTERHVWGTQLTAAPILSVHVVDSFSGMPPLCCLYSEKFLHELHSSVRATKLA